MTRSVCAGDVISALPVIAGSLGHPHNRPCLNRRQPPRSWSALISGKAASLYYVKGRSRYLSLLRDVHTRQPREQFLSPLSCHVSAVCRGLGGGGEVCRRTLYPNPCTSMRVLSRPNATTKLRATSLSRMGLPIFWAVSFITTEANDFLPVTRNA